MKKSLLIIFLAGILYRLWISNLVPQPFVFDQVEYQFYAQKILEKGLFAWTARLYGYPLFMAGVYKFFGINNFALAIVQAILDCLTGLLVYLTAKKIFKERLAATAALTIYIFNPFTSTLPALGLTELLTVFLIAAAGFLTVILSGRKDRFIFFLAGLTLGFLPQVRPSFLYYSFILAIITVLFFTAGMKNKIGDAAIFTLLFFLPFIYTVSGNLVYFNHFSLITVDNLFSRELYTSAYLPERFYLRPELKNSYPAEVTAVYNEYSLKPRNKTERELMARKYMNLAIEKISGEPAGFIWGRIKQMWYVWEKHSLYVYNNPENKYQIFSIYWGNNLLLFSAAAGMIAAGRSNKSPVLTSFIRLTVFTVFYISAVHVFSFSERYSLPAYPMITVFAGYALSSLFKKRKI